MTSAVEAAGSTSRLTSKVRAVVAVVAAEDAPRWLELALHSYVMHAQFIESVVVVTNDAEAVGRALARCVFASRVVAVLTDNLLLSAREQRLSGWARQQLVKLRAWTLTSDRYFVGADVDALLVRALGESDLLEPGHTDSEAVLYYHMPPGKPRSHVNFERQRIDELATLFEVPAPRARQYADFILDFFCFDRTLLRDFGAFMDTSGASSRLLQRFEDDPTSRTCFGEWTAYAMYALDVRGADVPIRNGGSEHFAQLYRASRFQEFTWGSKIVHFVDKGLATPKTYERLATFGLTRCE